MAEKTVTTKNNRLTMMNLYEKLTTYTNIKTHKTLYERAIEEKKANENFHKTNWFHRFGNGNSCCIVY